MRPLRKDLTKVRDEGNDRKGPGAGNINRSGMCEERLENQRESNGARRGEQEVIRLERAQEPDY